MCVLASGDHKGTRCRNNAKPKSLFCGVHKKCTQPFKASPPKARASPPKARASPPKARASPPSVDFSTLPDVPLETIYKFLNKKDLDSLKPVNRKLYNSTTSFDFRKKYPGYNREKILDYFSEILEVPKDKIDIDNLMAVLHHLNDYENYNYDTSIRYMPGKAASFWVRGDNMVIFSELSPGVFNETWKSKGSKPGSPKPYRRDGPTSVTWEDGVCNWEMWFDERGIPIPVQHQPPIMPNRKDTNPIKGWRS
jgi:hypothetical protein